MQFQRRVQSSFRLYLESYALEWKAKKTHANMKYDEIHFPQILMALHLSWVAAHQCLKGRGPIPIQSLTLQIMGWLIDQLLCVYF